MNYFELYNIPESFLLDEQQIKKTWLELSKKNHPDFYTSSAPEKQREILELSTLNNRAYKILSDFDLRMKYILQEHGFLEEEEKYTLPQMFLMEMMDLNELAMEIQFDPDPSKKNELLDHIRITENGLMDEIVPLLQEYDPILSGPENFIQIKEFYYKRKYLKRIREQLEKLNGET